MNIPHLTAEQLDSLRPGFEALAEAERQMNRATEKAAASLGRTLAGGSATLAAFAAAAAPGLAALEAEAVLAEEQATRAALEEIEAELDLPPPAAPPVELVCLSDLHVLLDLCATTRLGEDRRIKVEAARALAAIRAGRAGEEEEAALREAVADHAEQVGVIDCQPQLLAGWCPGGQVDQALALLEGALEGSTGDPGLGWPDRPARVRYAREALLAALVLDGLLEPVVDGRRGPDLDAVVESSPRLRWGYWTAWRDLRRALREQEKKWRPRWSRLRARHGADPVPDPAPDPLPAQQQQEKKPAPAPAPTAEELHGTETLAHLTWIGEVPEVVRVERDVWRVPPREFEIEVAAAEVARVVEDELERCLVEGRPWDVPGLSVVEPVTWAAWNLRHLLRQSEELRDPGLGVEAAARPLAVRLARAELRRAVVAAVLAGGCERWKRRPSAAAGLEPFEVPAWYQEPREWRHFGDDLP